MSDGNLERDDAYVLFIYHQMMGALDYQSNDVSSLDGEKISTLHSAMVATDVHRCLSLLQKDASSVVDQEADSALHILHDEEKQQTEIALRALIADQTSEAKKQELFAYIGAHENLFTANSGRNPHLTDFFFYLLEHFPLTIARYEMELAQQFPELETWIGVKTTQQKTKTKAGIFSLFTMGKKDDRMQLPPVPEASASFINRLAERIGGQDLQTFAQQVHEDIKQIEEMKLAQLHLQNHPDTETFNRISHMRSYFMMHALREHDTLPKWKEIGDAMIANGEFSLGQRGNIAIGWFKLPGFARGFATSDYQRNEQTNRHWTYNQDTLVPKFVTSEITTFKKDSSYDVLYKAIQGNDTTTWAEPIKATLHSLEQQGCMYDQQDQFSELIQRLIQAKGLSEEDALSLFAYLTGNYGLFYFGPQTEAGRKCLILLDGASSIRYVNNTSNRTEHASLLLAVAPETNVHTEQRALAA